MKENVLLDKSKLFALRIIKLYKFLVEQRCERILSKQILRSGTSVGANVKEAAFAQSKADFQAKIFIAQKECAETEYWLKLLYKAEVIDDRSFNSMQKDCCEIIRL